MHVFFKDTHPLLRCWWRRNCHSPFCIDAATVRAEPRRSRRGRSHTGGRPKTHGEDQNESEGQSNAPLPQGHRGIFLWWGGEGGEGGTHASCLVPAVWQRAESGVEACRRGLLYIHTVYTGREGGGERDAMPSHDLLFSSTLTWLPGKPVERRRRMGVYWTNRQLAFIYKGG